MESHDYGQSRGTDEAFDTKSKLRDEVRVLRALLPEVTPKLLNITWTQNNLNTIFVVEIFC